MALKRSSLGQSSLSVGAALIAGIPIGHTLTAQAATARHAVAARALATKTRTYKGPTEYVNHGPVQVSIVVKNKKITNVLVANAPEDGRSVFIQNSAIPILKQETLRAQSANINEVSGATDTSSGYVASLQSAVRKARQAKALR